MIDLGNKLYQFVLGSTLLLVLLVLLLPDSAQAVASVAALVLIALVGIPHGATDHVLFRHLFRKREEQLPMWTFYATYLALMSLYGLVWWIAPITAFVLFLVIAAFHFGQSNWYFLKSLPLIVRSFQYALWGTFVIAAPVLWHFEAAEGIIEHIVRADVSVIQAVQYRVPLVLLFVNISLIGMYFFSGNISKRESIRELLNLGVLSIVFYTMPLLLGFAIYFALWHALESGSHQINFFNKRTQQYTFSNFIRDALPYTLLALLGVAVFLWLQNTALFSGYGWAYVFIFISIVTLPHSILMHVLYQKWMISQDNI